MTEERDPEDKSVVLGVGDRKGLKDKIRDIYRRGRTKKGQEVRIIPPPEMELTNEIIVNSKEVDNERDASQSREESDIEIVSGENRSHRLLDMKLFERLKKHPVMGERPTKEEEEEGNSLLTMVVDEESDGLVDGTSTVNSPIMPGADQESVTETTSGSVRNYYPTTQRTNTEAVGSDLTLSADVLEDDLETTTNPPPSAPLPTAPVKPTLRITQKNRINVTPIAEPEPTTEPEPEPETTVTFLDHEFIKDPVQVLDNNSDRSEDLKLVPIHEPDNIEEEPEPETEAPNPEPESEPESDVEPEPEVEPESTHEPEVQPEPVTTSFPRIKIKTASTTPHTTPLPPAQKPAPMTPADARVGFLDFVSTVDNTVMHFTLSSPEKDESHLLTSYPAPTRPPRPIRPTPPPLAPVEEVTPTPAVISSSPPPGASTYYPTRIEPTSVTPPDDSSSKISHIEKVTKEVVRTVPTTTTQSNNIRGNTLATDGEPQHKVDASTLVPEQESPSTTTTTTTLKPVAELSFQEKLRRRFQKFRQSTVSRLVIKS